MQRFTFTAVLLAVSLLSLTSAESQTAPSTRGAWVIRREWMPAETLLYGRWVAQIHDRKVNGSAGQRSATLSQILTDPAMNPLLVPGLTKDGNDPRAIDATAFVLMNKANACGTLPALLLTYYCAVRGLPALFTRVRGKGEDIRYGEGNHPVQWLSPLDFNDLTSYLRAVCFGEPNFTTGNWRTAPDLEGTDTVPVAISRASAIPGLTLAYNPDGHALLVARVEANGQVNFLDSHPDGSITAGQTLAAVVSVTDAVPENDRKQWYPGWRMLRLAACVRDASGRIVRIRHYTNHEMRTYGFSDEQYRDVLAMRKGRPIIVRGRPVRVSNFPDYVRVKLRTHEKVDPCAMIREWTTQLHALFTERATLVTQAWESVKREGPVPYPDQGNIYQAGGRWERWASSSSDCDRKSAYFLGVDQLEKLVRDFDPKDRNLVLTGFGGPIRTRRDFALAILDKKRTAFAGKSVSFTTAQAQPVTLSLSEIEKRLFELSFDPNHAPEVRWGRPPSSSGTLGAPIVPTPLASGARLTPTDSYRRERRLRYRLDRKNGRTSFDDPDNPTAPPRTMLDARLARYVPSAPTSRRGRRR